MNKKSKSFLLGAGATAMLFFAVTRVPAQDAAVVNASTVTVKIDNSRVRVFEAVLEPGQREQLHSHPSTVVHVIAGGKVRNHGADGEPLTHWAENIGSTTLRVLVVELADPVP
jgi:hypothetical protein